MTEELDQENEALAVLSRAEAHLRTMAARGSPPQGVDAPQVQVRASIVEASADVLKAVRMAIEEVFQEQKNERAGQVDRGQPDPDPVHGGSEL